MKNCKDCIHEKVCVIKALPDAFENTRWDKEPCDHFKDKSLVLDLPCDIDAEIFMLKDRYKCKKIIKTDIVKAHIDCFTVGAAKRVIADVCDEEGDFYIALGAEDFYLNYDATEQALKERASDA